MKKREIFKNNYLRILFIYTLSLLIIAILVLSTVLFQLYALFGANGLVQNQDLVVFTGLSISVLLIITCLLMFLMIIYSKAFRDFLLKSYVISKQNVKLNFILFVTIETLFFIALMYVLTNTP